MEKDNVQAYTYEDGKLVPCEYYGGAWKRYGELPDAPRPWVGFRQMRRRLARQGTRGRRTALRVSQRSVHDALFPPVQVVVMREHPFGITRTEGPSWARSERRAYCVVYLPEGARVTSELETLVMHTVLGPIAIAAQKAALKHSRG